MFSSTLVVAAARPTDSTLQEARHRCLLQPWCWPLLDPLAAPQGPAIDVFFNLGGGRCWTRQQCPLRAPPSISASTSVVATTGPTGSAPQGTHHQCLLQPRWWPLPDPPTVPPRGLPSMSSSTSVVAAAGPTNNTPSGGPPSMSSST
jgi:hypothetical protein